MIRTLMRYTAFEFHNFKGIGRLKLHIDSPVTTLIGLNESGKTTILEAIYSFSYGAEDLEAINPELKSLRDPEQWIPIPERANFNGTIDIAATVELDPEDKRALQRRLSKDHGLTLRGVPDTITIRESHQFSASKFIKTQRTWTLRIEGTKGKQRSARYFNARTPEWLTALHLLKDRLPRISYFPNFLFELPQTFYLAEGKETDAELNDRDEFYRNTIERVLQTAIGDDATIDSHIVQRLLSENKADRRNLENTLLRMSQTLTDTIFHGWDQIFGKRPIEQEVQLSADLDVNDRAILEIRIRGADGYYELAERSLGFRWFFMFLLTTAFQAANSETRPVFLLDEPASNLHSSAQAQLLTSFQSLSETCTLIYATHSHHLINIDWIESSLVVENSAIDSQDFDQYINARVGKQAEITAVKYRKFVSEHPDRVSYFQPVLDILQYRPSSFNLVPAMVFVEGKSDFFILRYCTKVLKLGPSLNVAPGTGAGTLDTLIRLYIGWGQDFAILLDGDGEGANQRLRYERVFGKSVSDRCMLLPEVQGDPSIVEIEDLLSDDDWDKIGKAASATANSRPKLTKKLKRLSIAELVARSEHVDLDQLTQQRLETLVHKLAQRVAD